jgi:hypothetical protein
MVPGSDWRDLNAGNKQLVFFCDFAKNEYSPELSAAIVTRPFDIQDSHVWKMQSKAQNRSKRPHPPLALSAEQEDAVAVLIERGSRIDDLTSQRDVHSFVESEFGKCMTNASVHSFLARNDSCLCRTLVLPQEQTRLQVPRALLDEYMTLIKEWLSFVPAELILNIDECGFSDQKEGKAGRVLIPSGAEIMRPRDPVEHQIRHQIFICCIAAADDAHCPFLVTADASVTQALEMGLHDGIKLKIELASSSVSSDTFSKGISMKSRFRPSFSIGILPSACINRLFYYAMIVMHTVLMKC